MESFLGLPSRRLNAAAVSKWNPAGRGRIRTDLQITHSDHTFSARRSEERWREFRVSNCSGIAVMDRSHHGYCMIDPTRVDLG